MTTKKTTAKTHTDETGNPFNKEARIPLDKLSEKSWTRHVYRSIDLFKEGLTRIQIQEVLKEDTKLSDSTISLIIEKSQSIISQEFSKDDISVVGLHTERYNREINLLKRKIEVGFKKYSQPIQIKLKISAYFDMLDVMYQKEKLLQLHNKGLTIRVNQNNNTVIKEKKLNFNLDTLLFEEKVELLRLLNKSKKTSDEISGVILSKNKDIEEAEIIEETVTTVTNVDLIKQTVPEVVEERVPNMAFIDVKERLRLALENKAREEFKKAGSKIVDDENR